MVADVQDGGRAQGFRRRLPTLYALTGPFRRLFGSRRGMLILLAILLAAAAVPAAWWSLQLAGLPDVGEPFDVKAFRAETIPDGRNAFVLYRRAAALYQPIKPPTPTEELDGAEAPVATVVSVRSTLISVNGVVIPSHTLDFPWSEVSPETRAWVEANREALEVFREGSERPDAFDASDPTSRRRSERADVPLFLRLVLLEASRRESEGDMDGARVWYRAARRAVHHYGRRARVDVREDGLMWLGSVNERVLLWAGDPRTTPAQIRKAVDDVRSCDDLEPSEVYTIKADYVRLKPSFDAAPYEGPPPPWLTALHARSTFGSNAPFLTTDHLRSLTRAWHFWRREPERARRVFRLMTANRLAYEALPPDRRPKPEPAVTLCDLYDLGPDAPPAARAVSAKALGRWLDSCADAPARTAALTGNRLRFREAVCCELPVGFLEDELARREPEGTPPAR